MRNFSEIVVFGRSLAHVFFFSRFIARFIKTSWQRLIFAICHFVSIKRKARLSRASSASLVYVDIVKKRAAMYVESWIRFSPGSRKVFLSFLVFEFSFFFNIILDISAIVTFARVSLCVIMRREIETECFFVRLASAKRPTTHSETRQ